MRDLAESQVQLARDLAHRAQDPEAVTTALTLRRSVVSPLGQPERTACDTAVDDLRRRGSEPEWVSRVAALLSLADTDEVPEDDADAAVYADVVREPLSRPAVAYADARSAMLSACDPAHADGDRAAYVDRLLGLQHLYATPEMRATREGRALYNLTQERRRERDRAAGESPSEGGPPADGGEDLHQRGEPATR